MIKKKLLFIAPSNSIHSVKWIEFFLSFNVEIYWISFYKSRYGLTNNKLIKYYELSYKNPIRIYFILKKILNRNNFYLTHVHYLGRMIYLINFFNFNKLFVTPWGSDIKLLRQYTFKHLVVKKILNQADIITADSNEMLDLVSKISKNNNLKKINFGTDTDFFSLKPSLEGTNQINIISLRNFEKIYSIETLVESISLLNKNTNYEFYANIYGNGSEYANIKSMIDRLSLNEHIKLHGSYNYDQLPKILSSNHIYVSTSLSDAGIAASTSEAMSTGMLVISANNSDNAFWMSNKCGLLFETKNSEDLAAKILKFASMKIDEKKIFSNNARHKIIKHNSIIGEMNKMTILYEI
jgi:L-malate glycosyltransferase